MRNQKGFSLIELLIVVAIILIIAAIAIPNLLRSRIAANETSAVATLRTMHNAQATYLSAYPSVGFANELQKLGPPATSTTAVSSAAAGLIDNVIGCATEPCSKGGYKYFMTSSSSSAPYADYTASATPLTFGGSGSKNYCAASDGLIKMQLGATTSLTTDVTFTDCQTPTLWSAV